MSNVNLVERLRTARHQTDLLFELLRPGRLYDRAIPARHRLIFYLGHLEAFDWNQLARWGLNEPPFHAEFDRLFEAGIDPEPGQLPADQPADWPRENEVRAYCAEVRRRLDVLLPRVRDEEIEKVVEHRWMHAETFAYLLHQLPAEAKWPVDAPRGALGGTVASEWRDVPAGAAVLGRKRGSGFGWDNEFDEQTVDVAAFRVSRYKVTNLEYLAFVREGGPAPHFWRQRNGGNYAYRGMFAEMALPVDWPVYVTLDQARAYAQWKGARLMSEAEFHRAAYGDDGRMYPWGDAAPAAIHGNFDCRRWDPEPVTATPAGDSPFGVSQLVGNGWEWTKSPFRPLPGFEPMPDYPTYSAAFFDDAHYVIKGGSPRTAACLLRRSFRNWFRHDYPYLYATFRLVEN